MTIRNRTIFTGNNLHVLRGMESESVDLIYLDPLFNSNANYAAPIGSAAAGAAFKDTRTRGWRTPRGTASGWKSDRRCTTTWRT